MIKEFSLSEWVFKGSLICIGFMVTYITVVFIMASILYWAMTKGFLMYDTMMAILRCLTIF